MNRALPLLALAAALVGCDAGDSSAIEYQVSGSAATAEVAVDGAPSRTVSLPYTAESSGASYDIRATSASPVDVAVRVDGRVRDRATGRAVALTGDRDADEVEVKGAVDALSADGLTVLGVTFAVDAETEFDDGLAFGDLQVGDRVEVEGYDRGGTLVADKIEADDDDEDREVEVEGALEAVDLDAGTVTALGFTFVVDGETEIDGDLGLDALRIGDRVEVEGYFDGDDVLVADEIELDEDDDRDDDGDDD